MVYIEGEEVFTSYVIVKGKRVFYNFNLLIVS